MSYEVPRLLESDTIFRSNIVKTSLSYVIILVVWKVLSLSTGPTLMPGPMATFEAVLMILTKWALAKHIIFTTIRTIAGTVFTAVISLFVVVAAVYVPPVNYFFKKVIYPASRALPAVSFALIGIVWFGLGDLTVIFVVFITILPIYLIDLWEELKVTDQPLLEMARSLTTNEYRVFKKMILPMLVPRLFSSTKLNFSVAFKLALVGELLAAQSGMGFKLLSALSEFRTDFIFAWTLLVVIMIMLAESYVFDIVEKRHLTRWIHDGN